MGIYAFFSQVINKHWYWEVRSYAVRSFITIAPPANRNGFVIPNPGLAIDDQDNQWGGGVVGKIGYIFHPTKLVSLTPYFRLQYFLNNTNHYEDDKGNKIETQIASYLAGLKLSMDINDIFSFYVDYYGGYQEVKYDTAGFFNLAPDNLENIQLTSTFEIGSNYKINKCWTFIPYIQFGLASNKPSFNVVVGPINNNGTTTNSTVFAAKIAYKWP